MEARVQIEVTRDRFALREVFTIARGSRSAAEVLTVRVVQGDAEGRGECVPYARYDETPESVAAQIEGLPGDLDRSGLQTALPPGAARNAVDCAFWDLEAKQAGCRAWELAGLAPPDRKSVV